MSYGLNDATDERRVQALEAQAADLEKVAASLDATQPAAALTMRNQVAVMRQQAAAFRTASGLPPSGAWSTGSKVALGVAVTVAAVGAWWIGRSRGR